MHQPIRKAFTLIELLIVVAIIAILAAIAVPNFLEAQTRAKVSRARADMRTIDTGLNSYFVDFNSFPQCNDRATAVAYGALPGAGGTMGSFKILERLSTPISYLTSSTFRDAFTVDFRKSAATAAAMAASAPIRVNPATDAAAFFNTYLYQTVHQEKRATVIPDSFSTPPVVPAQGFFLFSVGPDRTYYNLGGVLANHRTADEPILLIYDPSNGTVSEGCIWRTGGQISGSATYAAGEGLAAAIRRSQ